MLGLTLPKILALLTQYGYILIFPISVVEGPIVSVISGFLVSLGYFNIIIVFFILLLGDLVGDVIFYTLGFLSRHSFIKSFGKYIGINEERVAILEKHFKSHDWKILLIGKTQPIGAAILFSAGVARMPLRKYVLYNVIGSVPKVIIFLLIGYYFGDAYKKIAVYLDYTGLISIVIITLLIASYLLIKLYTKSKNKDLNL